MSTPVAPSVYPNKPLSGGMSAAVKWLKGYTDASQVKTIAVRGGYILLPTQQPALAALYVNSVNKTWVILPVGLSVPTFERQNADGSLMFLIQGPLGDSSYSPFPFQEMCMLQTDGTFTTQQHPAYFPVSAKDVQFGSKDGEVLTGVSTTAAGLKFVFGGGSVADFISVPPTTINYNVGDNALVLEFASATLGNVSGLSELQSQYVQSVSTSSSTQGVTVTVGLTPKAKFYTGTVNPASSQTPWAEISFASTPPAPPWGP